MENNKFNKFYSNFSVSDLTERIRSHRITANTMDKEWYEALIKHLAARDITDEERKIVDHILSDDIVQIEELETLNNQQIEFDKKQNTQNHSNLAINPSNIISAGRNIKSVVYVVLVMTLFAVIAIYTANSSRDLVTIKSAYLFLGAASLICNIIILIQLHSAGDNLENSVYKKEE